MPDGPVLLQYIYIAKLQCRWIGLGQQAAPVRVGVFIFQFYFMIYCRTDIWSAVKSVYINKRNHWHGPERHKWARNHLLPIKCVQCGRHYNNEYSRVHLNWLADNECVIAWRISPVIYYILRKLAVLSNQQ